MPAAEVLLAIHYNPATDRVYPNAILLIRVAGIQLGHVVVIATRQLIGTISRGDERSSTRIVGHINWSQRRVDSLAPMIRRIPSEQCALVVQNQRVRKSSAISRTAWRFLHRSPSIGCSRIPAI